MHAALDAARQAETIGEVPIGCVVVQDNKIIATAHNHPINLCDPSGHAEILALRTAAKKTNNYRLIHCTVYVTLEPCMMCFGALNLSRIKRLVYGASDQQIGWHSQNKLNQLTELNHSFEITQNIAEQPCQQIIKKFFQNRR